MLEIVFEVSEDELDDGWSASAPGFGIHTEGVTLDELRRSVWEAVDCYFDDDMDWPCHFSICDVSDASGAPSRRICDY